MKKLFHLTAMLLALVMLLQCAAFAAEPDRDIEIPTGWAHDALAFCVDHGILNGDLHGNLRPTDPATRAQLAAMLVRMFAAKPEADLSGYTDVDAKAWYYSEMARAVAMGIFEGSGGKLNPSDPITREQAFTVMARAFGAGAQSLAALDAFPDGYETSAWARSTVAGMLEAGYVHGNANGTLNPKGNITRQELAQVLYNALDVITDDPTALTGARNLYTGPLDALAGKTVEGDLFLSCSSEETVTLPDFTVTGRLVLQLHNAKSVTLGAVSDCVCVCCPIELTLSAPAAQVYCLRDGTVLCGEASEVTILADTTLHGSYTRVSCCGGKPSFAADAAVAELSVERTMAGGSIALSGEAQTVLANASRLSITEAGHIGTLYQFRNDLSVTCTVDELIEQADAGLDGIRITQDVIPEAFYDAPEVTITGNLTGVNTNDVYGVPDGIRSCTVTYVYNGAILKTEENFALVEGAELSCSLTTKPQHRGMQNVTVVLRYGTETAAVNLKYNDTGRYTDYYTAQNVQTIHVLARVKYTTAMYSKTTLTGYMRTIEGNSVIRFLKYADGGKIALVETESGIRGWVSGSAIRVSWNNYHTDSMEYSTGVKEAFVNQVHNYSSPSKYLIWCNLYTTTVNIFEGSQGNWKLIKSSECAIGTPESPTRPGVFSIYSRAYYWSFDNEPRKDVDRCFYVSLFDGGIAFHSRLYYTGTTTMVDSRLSAEISHGCVRCPDEIVSFIYKQCPIGTTVVVY